MTAKAAVFDIGNVLIEWNYAPYMSARFGADRTARFLEETGIVEVHFRTDAGEPFSETIRAHAANHPDFADMIHAWVDNWLDLCGPVIGGMAEIMDELRARNVPIFALSNFAAENYEWTKDTFPILQRFDREFISGRMMTAKPDPAIYQAVEQATGLTGADLFFTDDRDENIASARARGWQAHMFDGADGLRNALRNAGLL